MDVFGAIIILVGMTIFGGMGFYQLERVHRRRMRELQHQQRLQLLNRTEEVLQVLIADRELGTTMYQHLATTYAPKALPPAQEESESASVNNQVVHYAQEVAETRRGKVVWANLTRCGLNSNKSTFAHAFDARNVTCKKCLRSLG